MKDGGAGEGGGEKVLKRTQGINIRFNLQKLSPSV